LLKVVPGSRSDAIVGALGERVKVKVSSPPEGGKANRAVCDLIADSLRIDARRVEIIKGSTSAEKTVRVVGLTAEQAQAMLLPDR
jgi:hypothetical protein